MIRERDIKNRVRDALSKLRLRGRRVWWFMPVQNGMGRHGVPDFIVCLNGRFIGIETKRTEKEQLTLRQSIEREKILAAAGEYYRVDASNVDQFCAWLESLS